MVDVNKHHPRYYELVDSSTTGMASYTSNSSALSYVTPFHTTAYALASTPL
jgi:hypothetical protein